MYILEENFNYFRIHVLLRLSHAEILGFRYVLNKSLEAKLNPLINDTSKEI